MGEDRIPKMILEWNAEGRREKPQEKWMDGIRRSMNRLELTEEDAQDRNLWKNKITVKNYFRLKENYCNVVKIPNKKIMLQSLSAD